VLDTSTIRVDEPASWSSTAAAAPPVAEISCYVAPGACSWGGRVISDVVARRARAAVALLSFASVPGPAQLERVSQPLRRICESDLN